MANNVKVHPVIFRGGLNTSSPAIELDAGECVQLLNYEVDTLGNYTRVTGYDRFDGRPAPSDVEVASLVCDTITGTFPEGETVTGENSGATGIICASLISPEQNYVALYDISGTFESNEPIAVNGTTVAVTTGLALPNYAVTEDEATDNRVVAREARRALVQPVAGSGPIRGVAVYKGDVYAFRDNEAGNACRMYKATDSGWSQVTTPTLNAGGAYEFRVGNFSGSAGTITLYGVDGVNKAFSFDGTTFTQIPTGMPTDTPTKIEVLPSQVLLLAFRGGSVLASAVGEPTKFSPIDGGGEMAVSDEVTELDTQADNSCAIFCRNKTYVLYGTSFANFNLTTLSTTTGAIGRSVQTIGDSIYLDDRGLTRLNRVQAFGNFDSATISQKIRDDLLAYTTRVTASFAVKRKNQYRICFDDGKGFILTFNGVEVAGYTSFDYGRVVRCAFSYEGANGDEVIFFGSDDGFIFQAEVGESFDGESYDSAARAAFYNYKSPEYKKLFKKITLEVSTPWQSTLQVVPDFDFSDPEVPSHSPKTVIAKGGGGYWGAALWDEFRWSAASVFTADLYIRGRGRCMGPYILSRSDREPPHTLTSMIVQYEIRSQRR